MNYPKIIHSADIHYNEPDKELALKSINTLIETGRREAVDLFTLAGDLFDCIIYNNTALDELTAALQKMLDIAPVVAVKGTPTHDVGDCYNIFRRIKARYEFKLLEPGIPYFLTDTLPASISVNSPHSKDDRLLILGCPEPSKSWFLSDKRMGREEANQKIVEGMRGILLGCGALRKQYPDIPCIFVYHGSVVGATMCNGQKMRPGEISIGRDDLALVGADYYALGHIHLAQQIGYLPAYYPGSSYPCDWGETDKKRFNFVQFNKPGEQVDVKFVYFPHSPRKKIIFEPGTSFKQSDIEGFQVWVEVRAKKEEFAKREDLAIKIMEDQIYSMGALPGSRVTTTPIAVETVRAAEITEKKALSDKVQVWGDSSGQEISDSVKEKADQLEAEAKSKGQVNDGAWIRLKRLRLRGAIGINDALGLEEIEIDFDRFDEGLVCFEGKTGSGKTTILENCQPFMQMLTRSRKLQDHFTLKDSCRDLYFSDARTETEYRAYIMIDGANKSGKAEPILYKKSKEDLNYVPITNGRTADYEQKIKSIFGSLNIFLRSAFAAQDQTQRIDKCTKGEKKELFRELAGLDYLQVYAEHAGEKAKGCEKRIADHQADVRAIEPGCLTYEDEKKHYEAMQEGLQTKKQSLKDIETAGKSLKLNLDNLEAQCKEQALTEERIKSLSKQRSELSSDALDADKNIQSLRLTINLKTENEKKLADYEATKAQYDKKSNELIKSAAKFNDEKARYLEVKKEYEENLKDLDDKIDKIKFQIRSTDLQFKALEEKIDYQKKLLTKKIECPKCKEKFSINQEQTENALFAHEKQRDNAKDIKNNYEKELSQLMHLKELFPKPPKEPQPSIDDEFMKSEIASLKRKLDAVNINLLREHIQEARDAEAKIKTIEESIKKLSEQSAELEKEIKAESEKINPDLKSRYDLCKKEYEDAQDNYREVSKEIAASEATIKALNDKLHDLANQIMKLESIKQDLEKEQQEYSDWSLLERACGPDGIQALELDALAPSISAEVNSLLETAFGSRFKVEIRTTREAGKGSKARQVEDFQILVHDERSNADKLLEDMSGGEKVLITRTICDAFGIINDRNTGTRYLTYFMDEADDGLDPEMKQHYFRIMETAHSSAHRYQTIVITHSREIQQMIQQKIVMSELKEVSQEQEVLA